MTFYLLGDIVIRVFVSIAVTIGFDSSVFGGILAAILQCNGWRHRNVKNVIATWRDRNVKYVCHCNVKYVGRHYNRMSDVIETILLIGILKIYSNLLLNCFSFFCDIAYSSMLSQENVQPLSRFASIRSSLSSIYQNYDLIKTTDIYCTKTVWSVH